jgi:hypothetical protein
VALEGVELTMLIQMGVLGIHQINRLLAVTALLLFLIRVLMAGITDQFPILVVVVAEVLEVLDLMVRQVLAEMVGRGRHQQSQGLP